MTCCDEGQLQAYLDSEISFKERYEIEKHLKSCDLCQVNLRLLKDNGDFTDSCLGRWGLEVSESKIHPKTAWSRFSLLYGPRLASAVNDKGVVKLTTKFKRWAVAVAGILVIGLSFTNSSVRAAASDFLTLFRVEKMQTIAINPQDLRSLEQVFREKGISQNIENFGKVTNNGVEPPKEIAIADAKKLADFNLLMPGYLPYQYNQTSAAFTKSGTVDLQLNVSNVNNLIKSLGGTTFLPEELDNQKFSLKVPNAISLNYRTTAEQGTGGQEAVTRHLNISQFRTPEISAPLGVNADQIREAILALPVIPDNIRRQLASIKDWQKTLVVPTIEGQTEEVKIGDVTALYSVPKANRLPGSGILAWESDGVLTIVEGDLSKAELVKVAENMK